MARDWAPLHAELVLHTALDKRTVNPPRRQTMQPTLRQLYQPKPDRTPAWLRRIWSWL